MKHKVEKVIITAVTPPPPLLLPSAILVEGGPHLNDLIGAVC